MASSKNSFLFLGALLVFALLISSEAAAAEESAKTNSVQDATFGGPGVSGEVGDVGNVARHCRHGCCRRFHHRPGCLRCCHSENAVPDAEFEDDHIKN